MTVLTGDRPTGKLHLGHYVGSIVNRLALQKEHKLFYMIADVQALTDNADNPQKVSSNVLEVALDNLAAGLDPQKTTLFIQSAVPEIAELTMFFLNLVTLARLERNPTVKDEMRQKGYGNDIPAGFLVYPVSQAADILAFKATVVPVGDDQLPMIEQANEIGHKFNTLYGEVFQKIEPQLSASPRLTGLEGKAKMSKSLNNAIFLADAPKIIREKVMGMYTDPLHLKKEDPGHLEGNTVFEYLSVFDPDTTGLEQLKRDYTKGGVGDVSVKERLADVLIEKLAPLQARREDLAKNPKDIMNILEQGTKQAREVAAETLKEVKKAIHINYFN